VRTGPKTRAARATGPGRAIKTGARGFFESASGPRLPGGLSGLPDPRVSGLLGPSGSGGGAGRPGTRVETGCSRRTWFSRATLVFWRGGRVIGYPREAGGRRTGFGETLARAGHPGRDRPGADERPPGGRSWAGPGKPTAGKAQEISPGGRALRGHGARTPARAWHRVPHGARGAAQGHGYEPRARGGTRGSRSAARPGP